MKLVTARYSRFFNAIDVAAQCRKRMAGTFQTQCTIYNQCKCLSHSTRHQNHVWNSNDTSAGKGMADMCLGITLAAEGLCGRFSTFHKTECRQLRMCTSSCFKIESEFPKFTLWPSYFRTEFSFSRTSSNSQTEPACSPSGFLCGQSAGSTERVSVFSKTSVATEEVEWTQILHEVKYNSLFPIKNISLHCLFASRDLGALPTGTGTKAQICCVPLEV